MLSGGGSALTLPLLLLSGQNLAEANATNRLGIIAQNFSAGINFTSNRRFRWRKAFRLILPFVLGTLPGTILAVSAPDRALELSVGLLMLGNFFYFQFFGRTVSKKKILSGGLTYWLLAFLIGIYAGFIQAGAGLLIISLLHRLARFHLSYTNVLKVLAIALISVISIIFFATAGLLDLARGMPLLIGSALGGYIGSKLNFRIPVRLLQVFVSLVILSFSLSLLINYW